MCSQNSLESESKSYVKINVLTETQRTVVSGHGSNVADREQNSRIEKVSKT